MQTSRFCRAFVAGLRDSDPDDTPPHPPDQIPDAPVKEPPDKPVNAPDAPVREPGPAPPKKISR